MDCHRRLSTLALPALALALALTACRSGSRVVLPVAFEAPAPAAAPQYPDDYRGFAAGRGRYQNFRLAFGQTLEAFEAEMLARLGPVLR